MYSDVLFVCLFVFGHLVKDKLLLKSSQQGHLLKSYYIPPYSLTK